MKKRIEKAIKKMRKLIKKYDFVIDKKQKPFFVIEKCSKSGKLTGSCVEDTENFDFMHFSVTSIDAQHIKDANWTLSCYDVEGKCTEKRIKVYKESFSPGILVFIPPC